MLLGSNICLRAVEKEDLSFITICRNKESIYKYFYEYEPLSLEKQTEWFEDFLERKNEYYWIISLKESNISIGTVSIYNMDLRNRKAEWGRFFIDKEEFPNTKGFGSEVEALVLRYVFDYLNLNRLQCEVFSDNESVINLHKSFGFIVDGKFNEHIYKDGKYKDVTHLSLLKRDYLSEITQNKIKKILG